MDIIFFFGFQKENLFDVLKKEFISGWNNLEKPFTENQWTIHPDNWFQCSTNHREIPLLEDIIALNESLSVEPPRSSRATEKTQTHYFHRGGPSKGANSRWKVEPAA